MLRLQIVIYKCTIRCRHARRNVFRKDLSGSVHADFGSRIQRAGLITVSMVENPCKGRRGVKVGDRLQCTRHPKLRQMLLEARDA